MPKFFSRMLAGLSIQAKIQVFIVPIALLVIAIASVSLMTGHVIGQQLEGAGQSIGVLTGFKQTYSEINDFLTDTNDKRRDQILTDLKKNSAEIDRSMASVEDGGSRRALADTKKLVDGLGPRVQEMWKLYQTERGFEQDIRANLKALRETRDAIEQFSDKTQAALAEQDNEAKGYIRKADFLGTAADKMFAVLGKIGGASDPKALADIVKAAKPDIDAIVAQIEDSVPKDQKVVGTTIKENLAKISEIESTRGDQPAAVQDIHRLASDLRPAGFRIRGMGAVLAQLSTKKFAQLDKPMEEAAAVASYAVAVRIGANNAILETTSLLGERDEAQLKSTLDSLKKLKAELQAVPKVSNAEALDKLAGSAVQTVSALATSSTDIVKSEAARSHSFASAAKDIDAAWLKMVGFANDQRDSAQAEAGKALTISLTAASAAVIVAVLATLALVGALKGPIRMLTKAMKDVAEGKLETDVEGTDRRDEIGDMARALGVFKSNAEDKVRFETEAQRSREQAEAERRAADMQKESAARQLRTAIDSLAAGLRGLANGDLTCSIETSFSGELDELRVNFNESLQNMRETLAHIRNNALSIQEKSGVLNGSANDLARRTEQQAASLEETAAAVDEMTSTVRMSSARAAETDRVASEILAEAEKSGHVVKEAIGAMSRIETASEQIAQIIGVIDNIAFQTNLLALNAGVEAARAGDAGKGFAVVAQEVRELAQRSASASKEIKDLITRSGGEVKGGVQLVGETGEVIERINLRIREISRNISDMAKGAQEQATGLQEVNSAVNAMDQMTQENAAMVEENNAASHALALEAVELNSLVARFRIAAAEARRQHYDAA